MRTDLPLGADWRRAHATANAALVQQFVPTDRQRKVANALGAVWAVVGLGTIVLINLTHSWWPVVASGILTLGTVVGATAWSARGHQQRSWETFLQIARSGRQRT